MGFFAEAGPIPVFVSHAVTRRHRLFGLADCFGFAFGNSIFCLFVCLVLFVWFFSCFTSMAVAQGGMPSEYSFDSTSNPPCFKAADTVRQETEGAKWSLGSERCD